MTPEQYHLQYVASVKEGLLKETEITSAKIIKLRKEGWPKIVLKKLRDAGFRVPKTATITYKQYNSVAVEAPGITLNVDVRNMRVPGVAELETKESKLAHKRRFLCDNSSPAAAKRFGAFARAKTGKKIVPTAQLPTLFNEWIAHNTGCTC